MHARFLKRSFFPSPTRDGHNQHLTFRKNFLYIFSFILRNYTTVSNFCRFGNQPPCVTTAAAVCHGGLKGNRHGPRQQGGRQRSAASSGAHDSLPPRATTVRAAPAMGHGGMLLPPWGAAATTPI
jgi:hypothetical protein